MKYDFKGNSIKEFSKLPRKAQFQIMEKLELYMSAPAPLNGPTPTNETTPLEITVY